jgi:hypothetical protein
MCLASILILLGWNNVSAESLFSPIQVTVGAQSSNATDARAEAMQQGEVRALEALLTRLKPGMEEKILKRIDPEQISETIGGVEVLAERVTQTRYQAKLRVSMRYKKVYELLDELGLRTAERSQTAALVIPIYVEEGKFLLWERENEWRNTWNAVALEIGPTNVIMPYGDRNDRIFYEASQIVRFDFDDLYNFARKYGVKEIVVPIATYEGNDEIGYYIRVAYRKLTDEGIEESTKFFHVEKGETKQLLMLKAARNIAEGLVQKGFVDNKDDQMLVQVRYLNFGEWLALRDRLFRMPSVSKVDIVSWSYTHANLRFYPLETEDYVLRTIEAQGLRLVPEQGHWLVLLR